MGEKTKIVAIVSIGVLVIATATLAFVLLNRDNTNDILDNSNIYDSSTDVTYEPDYENPNNTDKDNKPTEPQKPTEYEEAEGQNENYYYLIDMEGNATKVERDPNERIEGTEWTWGDLKKVEGETTLYTTPNGTVVKVYHNGEMTEWYKRYEDGREGVLVKDYSKEETAGYTNSRYLFGDDYVPTIDFTLGLNSWGSFKDKASENSDEYSNRIVKVTGTFMYANGKNVLYIGDDKVEIVAPIYPSDGVQSEVTGTLYFNSDNKMYIDAESIKIYY